MKVFEKQNDYNFFNKYIMDSSYDEKYFLLFENIILPNLQRYYNYDFNKSNLLQSCYENCMVNDYAMYRAIEGHWHTDNNNACAQYDSSQRVNVTDVYQHYHLMEIDIHKNLNEDLLKRLYMDILSDFFRKYLYDISREEFSVDHEKMKNDMYICIRKIDDFSIKDFFNGYNYIEKNFSSIGDLARVMLMCITPFLNNICILDIVDRNDNNQRYRYIDIDNYIDTIDVKRGDTPSKEEVDEFFAKYKPICDIIDNNDRDCTDLAIELNYYNDTIKFMPFISLEDNILKILL